MINIHRKGWALRYLREARAEFTAAQEMPYIAHGLAFEAARKAQAAIYYSLGDPAFIEMIVHQNLDLKQSIDDPILRFLVEIEKTVQQIAQGPKASNDVMFDHVDGVIQLASEVVELYASECLDD